MMIYGLRMQYLLRRRFNAIFALVTAVTICFCLFWVIAYSGWPENTDDGLVVTYKIQAYADHIRYGDLIPVWSSGDAFGYGTPMLLFYHRAFYYVTSIIFILFGSMKLALFVGLASFMAVGVYGMRFCLQKLTDKKSIILASSQLLLLANYSFINWLWRGAFSEFVAMMMIPWVIWWCLKLLIDKKFSYSIVVILLVTVYCHNVIGLMSLVPLLGAYLIYSIGDYQSWRRTIKPVILSGVSLLLLLAPLLLAEYLFLADYDPSKILEGSFLASNNFVPLVRNILPKFSLHDATPAANIQLDIGIWLSAIACLLLYFVFKKKKHMFMSRAQFFSKKVVIFLASMLIVFFVLQLKISLPIYHLIKPLEYLQFPFRLMTFMVPFSIISLAYLLSRVKSRSTLYIFLVIWVTTFVAAAPVWHKPSIAFVSDIQLSSAPDTDRYRGFGSAILYHGEFLPRVYENGKQVNARTTWFQYENLYLDYEKSNGWQGKCQIIDNARSSTDTLLLRLNISCKEPSAVKLPISYNQYSEVINVSQNTEVNYYRLPNDPRMIIDLPVTDNQVFEIRLPTLMRILSSNRWF